MKNDTEHNSSESEFDEDEDPDKIEIPGYVLLYEI